MALPNEFLEYPQRRHGMDHDLYTWSNLFERVPLQLPNNAKVGLMLTIPIEYFPLNPTGKPFKAPGSMVTNYPDFRHYTTRDYGNRVGIFRLLKVLQRYNIKANIAINAQLAEKYPYLINEIVQSHHHIIAHGYNMDTLHYEGLDSIEEEKQIENSLSILQKATSKKITGWISPAYSQSLNTLSLLAKAGIKFVGDWANDDLPYTIHTPNGNILSIPITQELSDRQIIINNHHTEDGFVQQVKDQFDCLYHEANKYGGRILSLTFTPYITGLPYRIKLLEEILEYLTKQVGVKTITAEDLIELYKTTN